MLLTHIQRFFFEVAYKGTKYSGFQIQNNAKTIQGELEWALQTYFKTHIALTGSSRTDAGVHAVQNFFHADISTNDEVVVSKLAIENIHETIYHINAILPADIILKNIFAVPAEMHSRFSASYRTYHYKVYTAKNPFLTDSGYYYFKPLDINLLQQAASLIVGTHDFKNFSKTNTQVFTTMCSIYESNWQYHNNDIYTKPTELFFTIKGNRFLRGMVRALVGTLLDVGSKKITLNDFKELVYADNTQVKANFSPPAKGLTLYKVAYDYKH